MPSDSRGREAKQAAHEPLILELSQSQDRALLERLQTTGAITETFDTIALQLGELIECRRPDSKLTASELASTSAALLGSHPECYGTWVYYPWSRRLVHVLPEPEFEELRTSRNRNKITREEQTKLARLSVGVVGLSVGQATALTLALEGIGGVFRLADFDSLALSNLNRLRAGVHELGVNKAVITARAIYEINPYATITVYTEGINEGNLRTFFEAEPPLKILFEECDDLEMKVRLREEARRRGVPVLMETSDRGMFDLERFDLEPQRPLFHGLVGEVDARSLRGLTTQEKVPMVLSILGELSPRAAASLVDIDATLKTWPQLASAVSLGAAVNTDSARRVALGQLRRSGRFLVDLERLIADEPAPSEVREPEPALEERPAQCASAAPTIPGKSAFQAGPLTQEALERLVHLATLAPSGGNCQPWKFVYRSDLGLLECWHAPERSESFLDFQHRAAHLALGAALENLRIGASALGVDAAFEPWPRGETELVAEVRFGERLVPNTSDAAVLVHAIEQRVTNRKMGPRRALPGEVSAALARAASAAGARLELIQDVDAIAAIGEIVARAEKFRMLTPVLHKEMISELRWSPEETLSTRDGLDLATLELSRADTAGLKLLRAPLIMRTLRDVGGGAGLKTPTRKAFAAASAIGVVTWPGSRDLDAYVRGGAALQRTWLTATDRGVALQPMTAFLYLLARLEDGEGEGYTKEERRELSEIQADYRRYFPAQPGAEIMLFRLAYTDPPSARSLRRGVHEVLTIA